MDAFNLTARLRLDTSEYDEALGRVRENLPRLGDESEETGQRGEQAAHRMGAAFKTVAVAVGAAVSAAAAGAGALVKQSVDAYANYEQLVGGVETLFSNLEGTVSAAPTVLENASNAYKTAGMSANEYMETVTSFSAALVSSLGKRLKFLIWLSGICRIMPIKWEHLWKAFRMLIKVLLSKTTRC